MEDQERIENEVNNISGVTVKTKGKKGKKESVGVLDGFEIGYAPSSRAKCRKTDCKIVKIEKNELRIAHKEVDEEKPHLGLIPRWHHVGCFKKIRKEYNWKDTEYSIDMVPGFNALDGADKKQLLEIFKKKAAPKNGVNKTEPTVKIEAEVEDKKNLEKEILKTQNKQLWAVKDALSATFKKSALIELLGANKIEEVPVGEQAVLDMASDLILFGRLPFCPKCSTGQLRVDSTAKYYSCSGYTSSGFTKCDYVSTDSKRADPKIPKWMKDECTFLFKFKYDSSLIRKFPSQKSIPPLSEMKILILGKIKNKAEVENKIKQLGGTNSATMDETVHLLITDKETFDRMTSREKPSERITKSQTLDTMILSLEFLDRIKDEKPTLGEKRLDLKSIVEKYKLSDWGSFKAPGRRKRKLFAGEEAENGNEAKKVKLQIHNGHAIDPEAEVKPGCKIIESNGRMHTSMMTNIDLAKDKNSYYKLQAIQNSKSTKFYLFRSWGRIGSDTIGGTKTETFFNQQNCLEQFYFQFEDKTGNEFFSKGNLVTPS